MAGCADRTSRARRHTRPQPPHVSARALAPQYRPGVGSPDASKVASWRPELLAESLLEHPVQQVSREQGSSEGGRREQRLELLIAPARAAGSEHNLDQDLFAPL